MSEQTVVAESSPAMEIDRGPLVNLTAEQRTEFRRTGEVPPPPKKEEPAPSEQEKPAQAAPAGESAPPKKTQEKPKGKTREGDLTADQRIAQLEATIEKIRQGQAGTERKTEPAPVAQPKPESAKPTTWQDWRKAFKPAEWVSQYAKDNPAATYEDGLAAMNDHLDEVRQQFRSAEQSRTSQANELNAKVADARARYGAKFDEVLNPTLATILNSQTVSPAAKAMLNDSEEVADLIYTLGSDRAELNKFLAMPPGKQLRYIALTESLIRDALDKGKAQPKPKAEEPPAKPQTNAPRPPAEVGGRAAAPGNELESAAKSNDFRRFKAEANRRALASLRG